MNHRIWKFWAIPLLAWCFYGCWACGYNSGYEEGHHEAWQRATVNQVSNLLASQGAYQPESESR